MGQLKSICTLIVLIFGALGGIIACGYIERIEGYVMIYVTGLCSQDQFPTTVHTCIVAPYDFYLFF